MSSTPLVHLTTKLQSEYWKMPYRRLQTALPLKARIQVSDLLEVLNCCCMCVTQVCMSSNPSMPKDKWKCYCKVQCN